MEQYNYADSYKAKKTKFTNVARNIVMYQTKFSYSKFVLGLSNISKIFVIDILNPTTENLTWSKLFLKTDSTGLRCKRCLKLHR